MEPQAIFDFGIKICLIGAGFSIFSALILIISKKVINKKLNKDYGAKKYGK